MCLRQTCRLDQEKGRVTIQSNSSKPRARLALPDASEMGSLDVQVRHVSDQREVNSKSRDTPATMDDCAAALLNPGVQSVGFECHTRVRACVHVVFSGM